MATLVVGDGNFSFSLALARGQNRGLATVPLVCSCLENEEDAKRYPIASDNICELRKLGVCVLHRVDGTRLAAHPQVAALCNTYGKFSSIIFNFPHSGGKGRIHQNRQLLQDFLQSSATHLSKGGSVTVTLGRGQGGTPVDDTRRGHHNSWQVLQKAAEAGLILSAVRPFCSTNYQGYTPTGYRGGGKGFMLDGALEHVFKKPEEDDKEGGMGELWSLHQRGGVELCRECWPTSPTQHCSPTHLSKLLQEQLTSPTPLSSPAFLQSWHPLLSIHRDLIASFRGQSVNSNLWENVEEEVCPLICLHLSPSSCCPTVPPMAVSMRLGLVRESEEEDGCCDFLEEEVLVEEEVVVASAVNSQKVVCQYSSQQFLPFILPQLQSSSSSSSPHTRSLYTVCGPIAQLGLPSLLPPLQPLVHLLYGVLWPPLEAGEVEEGKEFLCRALFHTVMSLFHPNSQYSVFMSTNHTVTMEMSGETCTLLQVEVVPVPHFHLLSSSPPPASQGGYRGDYCSLLSFTISLEALVMARYCIPDVRLLWSRKRNVISQFVQLGNSKITSYHPISLFPPTYTHDISFWIDTCTVDGHKLGVANITSRANQMLTSIVRCVAPNTIATVQLLDTYCPHTEKREEEEAAEAEESGDKGRCEVEKEEQEGGVVRRKVGVSERLGLCYRLHYSSAELSLSASGAASLQMMVRHAVAREEGVELR